MTLCNLVIKFFLLSSQLLASLCQERCGDNWYIPNHGSRRPSSFHSTFSDGYTLFYSCDVGYELEPDRSVQTCKNGSWNPHHPPKCIKITGQLYCPQPANITNGVVLCCSDSGTVFNPSDYCCKTNGEVQFECNPGYVLTGTPFWRCYGQKWFEANRPACQRDGNAGTSSDGQGTPHPDSPPISDEMMRAVIGVSAGVLGLLLLVVALAFCRPRLRDIKRRWQDFREDENGLIVNGQRVSLPTYEEATSVQEHLWCESHQHPPHPCLNSLSSSQLASSSRLDTVTRPPESNVTVDDLIVFSTTSSNSTMQLYSGATDDPRTLVQNQPGSDLTITEFLREAPCSSRTVQDDLVNFEDQFPIQQHSPRVTSLALNVNENPSTSLLLPTTLSAPLEIPSIYGEPSSRDDVTNTVNGHATNEATDRCVRGEAPIGCDTSMKIVVVDNTAPSENHHKIIKLDQFTVTDDVLAGGSTVHPIDRREDDLFDSDSTAV